MIIQSLADTDLYKFTMAQAVLHHFSHAMVEYEFRCRTPGIDLATLAPDITREVEELRSLRFTADELAYIGSLRFIKPDFVHFLRIFQLEPNFVSITTEGTELKIVIRGPWLHTIFFEVPILAIISELHGRREGNPQSLTVGRERLEAKVALIEAENRVSPRLRFSDFGTRRRFSRAWHEEVIAWLAKVRGFAGTSNVDLARRYQLTPIGTMAHEYLQAAQALGPRLRDSQKFALEHWVKEYRGDLGIALSDVVGFDAFLKDFDLYFAKLFDGCRQDSGDPYVWTEKLIRHYERLRIDPKTKQAIYSDALDIPRAIDLVERYGEQINVSFGIGTNFTHDVDADPLAIVIKMTRCQGQPVAKISDDAGKQMCTDQQYLDYLTRVFRDA